MKKMNYRGMWAATVEHRCSRCGVEGVEIVRSIPVRVDIPVGDPSGPLDRAFAPVGELIPCVGGKSMPELSCEDAPDVMAVAKVLES